MKIIIYSTPRMEQRAEVIEKLIAAIKATEMEYTMNGEFAEIVERLTDIKVAESCRYSDFAEASQGADIAVSYGGDGTFLHTVKLLGQSQIPILGVNSGRLGFLANVPKEAILEAFEQVKAWCYTIHPSSLLYVEGDFETPPEHPYAFNEFVAHRGESGMITVDAYLDGEMVAKYRGDGVMISTPAGSTAYSLSVGGPVVAPQCSCFVISPIAPHNLTMRPVIVPDNAEVMLKVSTRDQWVVVSLDHTSYKVRSGSEFRVRRAKHSVNLVGLRDKSFYDTLRNKMLWGVDRRNEEEEVTEEKKGIKED